MKPLVATFRGLLIAATAVSILAAPVAAHSSGGCKNDGAKVASHHHGARCCCGAICHCTNCPSANSSKHTPPSTPTVPDDGRVIAKMHAQSLEISVAAFFAPAQAVELLSHAAATANIDQTLIAQHTCLRM